MNSKEIQVKMELSDPWDFGESRDWKPVFGKLMELVEGENGGSILIKLQQAIEYKGIFYLYVVAIPRHKGIEMKNLLSGECINSSVTGITEERALTSTWFDLSYWRGGFGFRASITTIKRTYPRNLDF